MNINKSHIQDLISESINEVNQLTGDIDVDDDIKTAKKYLKDPHTVKDIEYNKTRRGEKYVKIIYTKDYVPGKMMDTGPHFISVFYNDKKDLKKIGKALKLRLKESVNEEYYDYLRDYRAGLIDKKTFDALVAQEKDRERQAMRHPYAKYKDNLMKYGEMRIYFNIPYSMKDKFKGYYGARWDGKRKQWYLLLGKTRTRIGDLMKYYDESGTDKQFRKYVIK